MSDYIHRSITRYLAYVGHCSSRVILPYVWMTPDSDVTEAILFEIFKLVDPADLLHLAHANKALRDTLLRKHSKWIWEYSVKHYRTPIPPCMDDRLPLPQYINLLFSHNCFVRRPDS